MDWNWSTSRKTSHWYKKKGIIKDGNKKARLVVKGYEENYTGHVYTPVAKLVTVKISYYFTCLQNDWELRYVNVLSAFPNGILNEDIYIRVPERINKHKKWVLKLNKVL